MVLASTIIAVALGIGPTIDVPGKQLVRIDSAAFSRQIGRYSDSTDGNGIRHLRGFDQFGRPYHATIDSKGRVECILGGQVIEFTVAEVN